jgi:hypothetical protein
MNGGEVLKGRNTWGWCGLYNFQFLGTGGESSVVIFVSLTIRARMLRVVEGRWGCCGIYSCRCVRGRTVMDITVMDRRWQRGPVGEGWGRCVCSGL